MTELHFSSAKSNDAEKTFQSRSISVMAEASLADLSEQIIAGIISPIRRDKWLFWTALSVVL